MCGIAGVINAKHDPRGQIKKMTDTMIHRGPDGDGFVFFENDHVALGHRRLAIIDLSTNGTQPMISRDKRYAIVLNGEIYNYKELRERLLQFGFDEFRSKCDTEILLEYFSMFGVEKTLEDINGMYAIGLYDRQEKKLTLIRDRGGEKPLYYGWLGNRFVFASELKAIKAIDYNSELNVCEDSAKLFLKYGFIPQPVSIYEKIYKLMSGSYLEIKFPFDTISEPKRYWTYGKTNPEWEKLEYNEAKEVLKDLLKKSVSRQMVADVPYGAFLSGGIDSSLITSIMQSVSDKPIKTFTIGLDDERFNEAKHAKQIAKYLGTDHTEYYLTEKELLEYIPRMCRVYDEPLGDVSQLAMCLVANTAKKDVTVCLSGDCGDELFLGYNEYRYFTKIRKRYPTIFGVTVGNLMSLFKFIDGRFEFKGKKLKNDLKSNSWDTYEGSVYWDNIMDLTTGNHGIYDIRQKLISEYTYIQQLSIWGFYTSMSDMILTKVDRATMQCSLENRVPFLDEDIMKFAFSIPIKYKMDGKNLKIILKDLLGEYIPAELYDRPKQGFSVPMHKFFRNELRDSMEAYINSNKLYQAFPFINKSALIDRWHSFLNSNNCSGMYDFWRLYMLAQWYEAQ